MRARVDHGVHTAQFILRRVQTVPTFDTQGRGLRSHRINFFEGWAYAILIQWSNIFIPGGETTIDISPLCEGVPDRHSSSLAAKDAILEVLWSK